MNKEEISGDMKLITEKRCSGEVIGWEYIPSVDLDKLRGFDIKEFFTPLVLEKKLKELNKGVIADENVGDVMRRLKLIPLNFLWKQIVS